MKVRNATTDDSGVYVCTAINGFGTVRVSFHVTVYRTFLPLYRVGQKCDTLFVFEFPLLLDALYLQFFVYSRTIFIK